MQAATAIADSRKYRTVIEPNDPNIEKRCQESDIVWPLPALLSTALQTGNSFDAAVAMEFYAAIGALMCLSWLLVFHVLSVNPHLLEAHVERTFFPQERHRALLGFALYVFAGMVGWFSPKLALVILLALPVFYGITSEGLIETRAGLLRRLEAGRHRRHDG
jgi:hypothetical protein